MKIGAVAPTSQLGPSLDKAEYARRVRMMDEAGFDTIWFYETYFVDETFARAGFIAACTERVKIGAGVINPYSRHPGLIALGAATIDRLSDGRLILLMGAGGRSWIQQMLGYHWKRPITDLTAAVRVIRGMVAGQIVTYRTDGFRIKNARFDERAVRPQIPIFLTADKESMIGAAAQIADGIFLSLRPFTGYVKWACDYIAQWRADTIPVEIGTEFPLRITADSAKKRQELKPTLAFYLSLPGRGEQYLQRAGFSTKILAPIRDAMKTPQLAAGGQNPLDAFRVGNLAEAAKHVPDELVDDSAVVGSPGRCRDRLAELEKAGLTFVALAFQPHFDDIMRRIHDILPPNES